MLLNHLLDAGAAPLHFHYWDDFLRPDTFTTGNAFTYTAIAAGTFAVQATAGGWGRISAVATTDDSGGQIQANAAFSCIDGKPLQMKARAQVNESTSANVATDCDLWVGLALIDTSIVASAPTDFIGFEKDDNSTAIKAIVRVGGVNNASITLTGVMDKSIHTYGIAVTPNGASSFVDFIMDGVRVARAENVTLPANTTILTPTVAFQSGDATGTKFVDVDYVGAIQIR